ncbi:DoxX family protein [Sinobaca sp. H24]|uniref:DoxX family protein n=1 Tax=Sinobaca sp. H24 TaxID=2923376 RepID=UPI00207A392E|nr:DoxX family protein [Sinobaca sp. H24]
MISHPQWAFLIARVVTAIVLIAHGFDKWGDTTATIEQFQTFGLSPLVAYVTSLVEIIAGFMLLVGLFVRLSAALLGERCLARS